MERILGITKSKTCFRSLQGIILKELAAVSKESFSVVVKNDVLQETFN